MTIKNIVFDLGGVLVDWNPRYLYNKIFDKQEEVDWFLNNICTSHWNAQQDAGRTMEEATSMLVERHPEYTSEIQAYYNRWTEMLNGPVQGSVQILEDIMNRGNHRLLALTNWSGETFPTALEMFDFLHWFEGIVVSGDEKLIKPDRRIFQLMFRRHQVEPQHSIFIDDSLPNVKAARELGMRALHFTDPDTLKQQLKEHGVMPP